MNINRKQATAIGCLAIFLWSTLALFTTQANSVPPMLLLTITFSVASVLFLGVYLLKGEVKSSWKKTPLKTVMTGGLSFFFYHYLYFYAFQNAPPVEAGLIAYLWPLLIVLMVGFTKGNHLLWTHLIGATIAFIGTGIMLYSKEGATDVGYEETFHWTGYAAAFACAFIWSGYSVSNRKHQDVPSSAVLWYCLITALLAAIFYIFTEAQESSFSVKSINFDTWVAIIGLGLGPVGIAFFCWDLGVKKGNLSLLGVLAYTTPAISTIWLALFTSLQLSKGQWIACSMITLGALFASLATSKKAPKA
ncbi:EamA family transporter [Marinomonas sp. C2222]|uniref:EamA family transporter n=1 Tax=Marinomonas sargassi TaxID=2984494 RepID=A0ABT2YQH9_9GAMM|nr:EamA family transporter [Marinomonas sargassi]MCV2402144.1 EamA family transporter [Marinomonas sargassi]